MSLDRSSESAGGSEPATRSFFDRRYTFPGFAFLLLVIVSFFNEIATFIINIFPGASSAGGSLLVGVLYFLSGSPLGFLVSQPWHFLSKKHLLDGPFNQRVWVEAIRSSGVPGAQNLNDSQVVTTGDLILHRYADGRTINYIWRRWDMFNILGSVLSALILASTFSLVLRGILLFSGGIVNGSLLYYIPLYLIIGAISYSLWYAIRDLSVEHANASLVAIAEAMKSHYQEVSALVSSFYGPA